jgi:hypothetical protein
LQYYYTFDVAFGNGAGFVPALPDRGTPITPASLGGRPNSF